LQNVLQRLLVEWVPIRDLLIILETIADGVIEQRDINGLVEHVRRRLGRTIVQPYLSAQGELSVFTLDAEIEQTMAERIGQTGNADFTLPLELQQWQRFVTRLNDAMGIHDVDTPVVLTTPLLRAPLAQALTKMMSRIAVLSVSEIPTNMNVKTLAGLGLRDAG